MARLRVVLVEDGTFPHGTLRPHLEALDAEVVAEGADWSALADQAEARSGDLFVLALGSSPDLASEMTPGDRAVVVVAMDLGDPLVAQAIERGAFAFVPFPLDAPLFHAQARAAILRARETSAARRDAAEVRDQLETRKLVERAKGILMERLGLSEHEAFRKLQRASQDENRKMREIADSVIRAEKMFGVRPEDLAPRQHSQQRARPAS
jgi:response regulator NasT